MFIDKRCYHEKRLEYYIGFEYFMRTCSFIFIYIQEKEYRIYNNKTVRKERYSQDYILYDNF